MILLTGSTGYVGGELLPVLEKSGRRIRCLARNPDRARRRAAPGTDVVCGDVLDAESLGRALAGVDAAYYLVHSMGSAESFEDADRTAARNFAEAAGAAGVKRIIYLGGLGRPDESLSPHLRSRQEVGRVLASTGVPVIELRSSIVLGSGSISFEMIRALVERLPVMVTPRWVATPTQPIAIGDLIEYLVRSLDIEAEGHRIFEIGGGERTSYGGIMREYARQRRLRRWMIPVPVLTPKLSSLWLGLVTPYYARIGRALIDSLKNPTVIEDPSARETFRIQPMGFGEAISRALEAEDRELAAGDWEAILSTRGAKRTCLGILRGSRIIDDREAQSDAPPEAAFAPIRTIGGRRGWYYGDALWKIRGAFDRLLGGIGMSRGRRDPERLEPGDALDCWRVEAYSPDRRLLLAAEMKMPGRAWLEFQVEPRGAGSRIRQTVIFEPRGIAGLLYWCLLLPAHGILFKGMLREVVRRAAERSPVPQS